MIMKPTLPNLNDLPWHVQDAAGGPAEETSQARGGAIPDHSTSDGLSLTIQHPSFLPSLFPLPELQLPLLLMVTQPHQMLLLSSDRGIVFGLWSEREEGPVHRQNRCSSMLAYPCFPHRRGRPQDLSPGLSELHILRLHLALLSLSQTLPLGADEDGWLQRSGRLSKVFHVCSMSPFKRLMGHLREKV